MKTEIIPAILAHKKKEFFERLDVARSLNKIVQIDLMDGAFVDSKSPTPLLSGNWFNEYLAIRHIETSFQLELHLMVTNPWKILNKWKDLGHIKRVIWHLETPIEHAELIYRTHELGFEAGLAINPETKLSHLIPFLEKSKNNGMVDSVLIMGVKPGYSGQKFQTTVLKKIRALRKNFPKLNIGVDGGVNQKTAGKIIFAGANILNASGAIFLADDPKKAYAELKMITV